LIDARERARDVRVVHVAEAHAHVRDADLGYADDGITHVSVRFGYMDDADVPRALSRIDQKLLEAPFDPTDASYFLSTVDLFEGDAPGMSRWRKKLFLATT